MGFCETEPIPTAPSRSGVLTSEDQFSSGWIAAFGVVFGLALVSVAYGETIIEKTCECLAVEKLIDTSPLSPKGFFTTTDGVDGWRDFKHPQLLMSCP